MNKTIDKIWNWFLAMGIGVWLIYHIPNKQLKYILEGLKE